MANFETGKIVFTIGSITAMQVILKKNDLISPTVEFLKLIEKHKKLDQGILDPMDHDMNKYASENGERIISAYMVEDTKFWIITEADRSVTTILLPEEY